MQQGAREPGRQGRSGAEDQEKMEERRRRLREFQARIAGEPIERAQWDWLEDESIERAQWLWLIFLGMEKVFSIAEQERITRTIELEVEGL